MMSYDHAALASLVQKRLAESPHLTLVALCSELQIDRHTIADALFEETGKTFRQLKNDLHDKIIQDTLADGKIKSIKQAAAQAGYQSAGSLARKTRRSLGVTPGKLRRRQ